MRGAYTQERSSRAAVKGVLQATKPCRVGLYLASALFLAQTSTATAGPWSAIDDIQQRSDIEYLAATGTIDNITTQWPIPWGGILYRLQQPEALRNQSAYTLGAINRLVQRGEQETRPDSFSYGAAIDLTTMPDIVRGYGALGREQAQSQMFLSWNGTETAARLAVGVQSSDRYDHQALVLDGSYIAQRIGNAAVYAGYMPHWWGPGWISALSVSTNARPIPQIGVTRISTTPFSSPWLSWLGPWQAEFFAGVLDGKRIAQNTLLDGLRFSFNPLPGLEIGVARLDELCGTGHPCKPVATYFNLNNTDQHPSRTNDQGNIDIKYSGTIGQVAYSIYAQMMNEDTSPITYSGTSHLFGLTTWIPVGSTRVRLTAEYTSSIATTDIFSFGDYRYGFSYNDYKYVDGMRYRDRTLGFSLDNDSRLATLQASWLAASQTTYTLTFHHANIGSPNSIGANIITHTPVPVNIAEARVSFPVANLHFDVAARVQDRQILPQHGALGAVEVNLVYDVN